ncbi:MAG: tetratricopeptide repeat protein [Lentisphaerae bacterium]|nr:tetratricopeptide repeat protein [Lentisphaerota bacterium]
MTRLLMGFAWPGWRWRAPTRLHGALAVAGLAALLSAGGSARAASEREQAREAHWRAGAAAFEDGLFPVAEQELQKYLKSVVEDEHATGRASEAVTLLARTMLAEGRTADLLDFLKEQRWWMRHAAPGAIPFWRALVFYETKDARRALDELDDFAKAYPGSAYLPRAQRLSAWCQFTLGNTNGALRAFADFDQAYRGTLEGAINRLEWSQALVSAGQLAEAVALLKDMDSLTTDPILRAKGILWRSRVMITQRDWQAAVNLLDPLLKTEIGDPNLNADCWYALARARAGLGDRDGAADALTRGLRYAQDRERMLSGSRRLGLLYLDLGQIDEGVDLLRKFVATVPSDPRASDAQLAVAGALLEAERFPAAADAYQFYLESFTNEVGVAQAHRGRGWALQGAGRYAEAAAAFEKAYAGFTAPAEREECLYKAADAYFANQQYKLAAQRYERLLNAYPESERTPMALYQLAQSQSLGEDAADAVETYGKLAARFPQDPLAEEALLRLAQLHEVRGDAEAAAHAYSALMRAYTNGTFMATALLGRGLVHFRLGRQTEAYDDFARVVNEFGSSPEAEQARYQMIMSDYVLGRTDQALAGSRDFLGRYPGSAYAARVQYGLGKHAFNAGQYAEAERQFLQFHAGHPTDPDAERALLWAGRAAARSEDYLRANEILTTLLQDFPQGALIAEARFEQGMALTALAKFAEAILAFQEVINRFPQSDLIPETWLRVGDCRFMLGSDDPARYEAAMSAYRAASSHPNAKVDLILQAEYKIGRCMQKLERPDEAIEQYYKHVMLRFLEDHEKGVPQGEAARMWFGRASRDAAGILEERGEWRKVVGVLDRAVAAGVPDEAILRQRIQDIRTQHWWLFY